MKTLIINGSPHLNGETASMISCISHNLIGEIKRIDTYYAGISPCNDCRLCHSEDACSINDGMEDIYLYIKECDNVIFASPLYFSQFTGSFLSFMSRLQRLSAQKYIRKQQADIKPKKGLVLLNGGGSTINTTGVEQTARILMRELNVTEHKFICYVGTDKKTVTDDDKTKETMLAAVSFLNGEKEDII